MAQKGFSKPNKLVKKLDELDHSERVSSLARHLLGLDARVAAEHLDELWSGDVHERHLALMGAATLRDIARITRGLRDESVSVRRVAASAAGRLAEHLPAEVADLDAVSMRVLIGEVIRRGSRLAPELLQALLARGRIHEAARVLSACPPDVLRKYLDAVPWPSTIWPRLAKHAPDIVVERVEAALAETDRPDLEWSRYPSDFWLALALSRPERVARLVDAYADAESLPAPLTAALTPLARHVPGRVVQWLASRTATITSWHLPTALLRRLRKVGDDTLAPLCRGLLEHDASLFARALSRLPHARRARLFEHAVTGVDTSTRAWPLELLAVLPEGHRDREARRMLELPDARKSAAFRRMLLGFRDIGVAREPLEQECRRAEATDRAEAFDALVSSTGRSRRGMAETLATLARIKNEQDPVRAAALGALARVPARLFTDAAALDAVLSPIFDARDTSYMTRAHASRIAHRLLVENAARPSSPMLRLGLSLLERLAGHAGTMDLPLLAHHLPRGAEHAIAETLLPWVDATQKRNEVGVLFALWRALGKRAWNVPELSQRIERAIWKGPKGSAGHAAHLWLEDPETRDARVRELLRRDSSAIYLAPVVAHCHRRRQSLLGPRFDLSAHRGRFWDQKIVSIPWFSGGFARWSPGLMQSYVKLLRAALADPKRFSTLRALIIGTLARVPTTSVRDVMDSIRADDVVELEAALGALVWTDRPAAALTILAEHLESDRARVAMYAFPRLARLLEREQVVDALAQLLARPRLKLTAHKEIVRLLGQYSTPRALELLRKEWAGELHRDVRIAALHAARSVLENDAAWAILGDAARDPNPDVARSVVDVHAPNIASAFQARYLETMAVVADHPDPDTRRALLSALNSWAAAAPMEVAAIAARVLERLDPLDPWELALDRAADAARSRSTHESLLALVDRLLATAQADREPRKEGDQLARRRLCAWVAALARVRNPSVSELLSALAERLGAERAFAREAALARIAAATNAQVGEAICELCRTASPLGALAVRTAAESAARDGRRGWTAEQALGVVDIVMGGLPSARLAAPALVGAFGSRWGWGREWTDRLRTLRHDADPDVQIASLDVAVSDAGSHGG